MTLKLGPVLRTFWPAIVGVALFAYFYFLNVRHIGLNEIWAHGVAWRLLGGTARAFDSAGDLLNFPLNIGFFHGLGDAYLSIPFVWLFGHTTTALTWHYFTFAAFSIILIHRISLLLYHDAWAAAWSCLMLAATPSFVTMAFGASDCALGSFTFGLAGIYWALRYADERRPRLAYLGCFCLGAALSCRAYAAALLAGLLTFAIIHRTRLQSLLPGGRARRSFLAGCCGAFLLFMLPFLLAILQDPHGFATAWGDGLRHAWGGRDHFTFWDNIWIRIKQLRALLNGKLLLDSLVRKPDDYRVFGGGIILMSALAGILWTYRCEGPIRRRLPGIVVLVSLMLAPFSPTVLRLHHLCPILPHLLLAAGSLIALTTAPKHRPWVLAVLFLLLAGRIWNSTIFFHRMEAELSQTGGVSPTEIEIMSGPPLLRAYNDLAECLSEMGVPEAIMLNYGPVKSVTYLTGGSVQASNILPVRNRRYDTLLYDSQLEGLSRKTAAAFVVDITPGGFQLLFQAFQRKLALSNKRLSLRRTIRRPNGEPVYAVYQIAPRS
ncbi:MAG: hypothetical protein A2506_12560 [Elusimicrobia bacterium RIFOXYD12_FULL_66_9]|nr:MAG: hypothetical protein A2506_12560 [Elusimicrobia bacterium RIFOXYD12_FULL_66_9]